MRIHVFVIILIKLKGRQDKDRIDRHFQASPRTSRRFGEYPNTTTLDCMCYSCLFYVLQEHGVFNSVLDYIIWMLRVFFDQHWFS